VPYFRCTSCGRGEIYSAHAAGAGDCPHCGGDLVFDRPLGAEDRPEPDTPEASEEQPALPKGALERLRKWFAGDR
jgi:hypothetical protein